MMGLMAGIYQYIQVFQTELVGAFDTDKKANGHSWSEMPCTAGLCIKDDKVGIGTESVSATDKLGVLGNVGIVGDLQVSGNICNGAGACLSALDDFVGTQPLYKSIHTYKDCTDAGGEVVPGDTSMSICRFGTESNPVDNCDNIDVSWDWYEAYSTVEGECCTSSGTVDGVFTSCYSCSPIHAWGNKLEDPGTYTVIAYVDNGPWGTCGPPGTCCVATHATGCAPGAGMYSCATPVPVSNRCENTSRRIQVGCF